MLIKVGYVFEIKLFKYQRSIFSKIVTFVLIIFVLSDFMIRKLNLQSTCIILNKGLSGQFCATYSSKYYHVFNPTTKFF